MSLDYRNNILDILQKYVERYRIKNLTIPSFVANYGYQLEFSAMDMLFCVMASIDFNDDVYIL